MKILIIGGVAGGASAAARIRRLDEKVEIVLFERGEYISFANCGLPYHISKTIPERDSLLVMTPESMKGRANIDVRIKQEVISINKSNKKVEVKNLETGKTYEETYDKLILSPGSSPLRPPIPGADDPDVFVLWTIPDMDKIMTRINNKSKKAVVVGGGFIGLEVAENLAEIGIKTTIVEMLPQILPPMDIEMTTPLLDSLSTHGVKVIVNNAVSEVKKENGKFNLSLNSGKSIETDIVIFAAGVRPNSKLAIDAELKVNKRDGIVVNDSMQTSDPDIYAIGDAIQVKDLVLDTPTMIPLAGPANKQGRIAAENVLGGKSKYKGSLGTSICKIFEKTAASTGVNEKKLIDSKIKYKKLYITPNSNAGYYPGSAMMYIKVLFDEKGRILGSQIVGTKGVDKRIDVLATAIRNKLTLTDLEELELAYAPPYGSAKDPINFVGFVGNNILRGDSDVVFPNSINKKEYLIDVREPDECMMGIINNSVNIPLGQIRDRLNEIPKNKEIVVYCKAGLRGYLAERILKLNGFKVKNLSGGYEIWKLFNPPEFTDNLSNSNIPLNESKNEGKITMTPDIKVTAEIDARGLQCPGPIVKVKDNLEKLNKGETLKIKVSDMGFVNDIPAWCKATGNTLIDVKKESDTVEALIQKGSDNQIEVTTSEENGKKNVSIVLFSNDLDKALAAMIIASGFATLGHEVSIFFTFWGINVLRKDNPHSVKKDFMSKMFGFMMPRGPKKLALSKMHMMGMGTKMMKNVMKSKNIDSLPELMKQAQELGVRFLVCEMAMNMMGVQETELIDNVELAGVANFAVLSSQSTSSLFI
ncbi:MAG TPA: FAD-dependent oxidoreductase [Victivallales bacterium]|nr:FAD-dependent oxidoreductase [Victivallales bacterium]